MQMKYLVVALFPLLLTGCDYEINVTGTHDDGRTKGVLLEIIKKVEDCSSIGMNHRVRIWSSTIDGKRTIQSSVSCIEEK